MTVRDAIEQAYRNGYEAGVKSVTDNNVGGKWIPVTERLPKVDEIVMCYRTGKMFLGTYLGANYAPDVAAFKSAEDYYARGATHWMPLPEPPKGE